MTFGQRLIELRKENGYNTRNDFAEKLGIPSTTLRNYEKDEREPGHTFLKQISELFNVSVDYLLCLTDNKEVLNSFRLRVSEQEFIEKYRFVTEHSPDGAEAVSYILDREYKVAKDLMDYDDQLTELKKSPTAIVDIHTRQPQGVVKRFVEYFHSASAGSGVFILGNEVADQIEIPDTPENRKVDFAIKVSGDSMIPDYNDNDIVLVSQKAELNHGDVGIFIVNNNAYIKEYGKTELISRNPDADNIKISEYDNIVCMGKVVGKLAD